MGGEGGGIERTEGARQHDVLVAWSTASLFRCVRDIHEETWNLDG